MVAVSSSFLPVWFTRMHNRFGTPVNSIVFVGVMTFAFSLGGVVGVGKQEGFQLLWNASAIFYALTYLAMFALPIVGLRRQAERAPVWLRIAALSGFAMTLLYVVLSILPIVSVTSRLVFAVKISAVVVIANMIGALLFLRNGQRQG
jgi:glutamate:GABA antiporter